MPRGSKGSNSSSENSRGNSGGKSQKGLASVSKQTREEAAKKGGRSITRGWS